MLAVGFDAQEHDDALTKIIMFLGRYANQTEEWLLGLTRRELMKRAEIVGGFLQDENKRE